MPKHFSDFKSITASSIPPVVALGGEERSSLEQSISKIRTDVLRDGVADFNHDRIDLKSRTLVDALSAANNLPMMASYRLVEVENGDAIAEEDFDLLLNYVKSPNPTSVLLIHLEKINLKKKLYKRLDKAGVLFRFDHPKSYEMPEIIRSRVRAKSMNFSEDALEILKLLVGTDLRLLDNYLEKLNLSLGAFGWDGSPPQPGADPDPGRGRPTITLADISKHLPESFPADAFSFVRALVVNDKAEMIRCLGNLEAQKEQPIKLLGLMAWQCRQVINAYWMLKERIPKQQVTRSLGLFGSGVDKILKIARNADINTLNRRLTDLSDVDIRLKSSRVSPWLWLSSYVMEME